MTKDNEKFVITGKAFWPHVRKVKELSGNYQLDLSVDADTAKLLESKGVKLKHEEKEENIKDVTKNRGTYVTLKSSSVSKDGTLFKPPIVIDGKKNVVPEDVAIGNGSIVNVETRVYDWTFKGKKGKGLGLGTIQIKALVEFKSASLDAFEALDDGYVVSESKSATNEAVEATEPLEIGDDSPFDD